LSRTAGVVGANLHTGAVNGDGLVRTKVEDLRDAQHAVLEEVDNVGGCNNVRDREESLSIRVGGEGVHEGGLGDRHGVELGDGHLHIGDGNMSGVREHTARQGHAGVGLSTVKTKRAEGALDIAVGTLPAILARLAEVGSNAAKGIGGEVAPVTARVQVLASGSVKAGGASLAIVGLRIERAINEKAVLAVNAEFIADATVLSLAGVVALIGCLAVESVPASGAGILAVDSLEAILAGTALVVLGAGVSNTVVPTGVFEFTAGAVEASWALQLTVDTVESVNAVDADVSVLARANLAPWATCVWGHAVNTVEAKGALPLAVGTVVFVVANVAAIGAQALAGLNVAVDTTNVGDGA